MDRISHTPAAAELDRFAVFANRGLRSVMIEPDYRISDLEDELGGPIIDDELHNICYLPSPERPSNSRLELKSWPERFLYYDGGKEQIGNFPFTWSSVAFRNNYGSEPEDQLLIRPEYATFGVFDGAYIEESSEANGAIASSTLLNFSNKEIAHNTKSTSIQQALVEAITYLSDEHPSEHLGSTATIGKLRTIGAKLYLDIVHIGDSRLYLDRDGKISQISVDTHDPVIFERLMLHNRYLEFANEIAIWNIELRANDRLVFATDGAWQASSNLGYPSSRFSFARRIALCRNESPKVAANVLARSTTSKDDISVIVVDVGEALGL